MGRRNDPLVSNKKGEWGYSTAKGFTVRRLEDGSVDWSDPNIISPYMEEREKTDYNTMDEILANASELGALSSKTEPTHSMRK